MECGLCGQHKCPDDCELAIYEAEIEAQRQTTKRAIDLLKQGQVEELAECVSRGEILESVALRAATRVSDEAVFDLLGRGYDVNAMTRHGHTVLSRYCKKGDLDMVKNLVENYGAQPHTQGVPLIPIPRGVIPPHAWPPKAQRTGMMCEDMAFWSACGAPQNAREICEYLLDHGAQMDSCPPGVFCAAFCNRPDLMGLFLEKTQDREVLEWSIRELEYLYPDTRRNEIQTLKDALARV